jgi:hypothetical protein
MKFDTFWQLLAKKISKQSEFYTLKRHTLFSAEFSFDKVMVKPNTTKFTRQISQGDFQKIWNRAYKISLDEQFNPVNYQEDTFHASYILAMIKSVIGNDTID